MAGRQRVAPSGSAQSGVFGFGDDAFLLQGLVCKQTGKLQQQFYNYFQALFFL